RCAVSACASIARNANGGTTATVSGAGPVMLYSAGSIVSGPSQSEGSSSAIPGGRGASSIATSSTTSVSSGGSRSPSASSILASTSMSGAGATVVGPASSPPSSGTSAP